MDNAHFACDSVLPSALVRLPTPARCPLDGFPTAMQDRYVHRKNSSDSFGDAVVRYARWEPSALRLPLCGCTVMSVDGIDR